MKFVLTDGKQVDNRSATTETSVLSANAGSLFYIASDVLCKFYGLETDVGSAGIILYIILSKVLLFWSELEQEIFEVHGAAWTSLSSLQFWVTWSSLQQWKKLKKMALRFIAQNLSEEEIVGLKEMFKMLD